MSAIIHSINQPTLHSNKQHKQLVKQITDCLNVELSKLLGCMFDGADDILFQLAENAESNEDQSEYFDTMRMLRLERKNINQKFSQNLNAYLQSKQIKEKTAIEDEELSLVDQDEMEELVAVSAMHSKAMSLYGEAVNHLEARIEFFSLKSTLPFDKNSLDPKNICTSFKDALSDIELSTNNKLVLYKLFDQEVIVNLTPLYESLNQIFIDLGVLPKIKLAKVAQKSTSHHNNNSSTETSPSDAVYTENPTHDTLHETPYRQHSQPPLGNINGASTINDSAEIIQQLLHGELTASGHGIPASFTTSNNSTHKNGVQYFDRRHLMRSLSTLQQNASQLTETDSRINTANFKRSLLTDMASHSGGAITKQINQVDEKTIDFIEMLFSAITDDLSIPNAITNLLLRLQIPVIKTAMLDNDFFTTQDHPCRMTLNLISHLGRGVESLSDDLFSSINNIVENLLSDFDTDVTSFKNSQAALEKIEQEELNSASKKERETQKLALQEHAREVVLAELQYLTTNKTLPKTTRNLILKHWSTLMFHCYIKFGKNSNDWSSAVFTIKKLISFLQPIESSQAYYQLENEKDGLLHTLQTQLLDTTQNPVDIEMEINHVFLQFESMLKHNPFITNTQNVTQTYFTSVNEDNEDEALDSIDAHAVDEMQEPILEFEEEDVNPLEEQATLSREKISKLPSDVRPGVWFKVFNGEDKAARRVKLSVIIMEEAKLIFVDRLGLKILEKDAGDFTMELANESSQFIADHSAFDHALGQVINSLSPVQNK